MEAVTNEPQTILVTGFGPFGKHSINASWEAVKELGKSSEQLKDDFNIDLIIEEIPVIYDYVSYKIPELWKKHNPLFVIHVGVSDVAGCLTIESAAHSSGYCRGDITNQCPIKCKTSNVDCKEVQTGIDIKKLCDEVNKASGPCRAVVSTNAGRYLCEYIYYQSLDIQPDRTLFVHVPEQKIYPSTVTASGLYFTIVYLLNNIFNVQLRN